MKDKRNLVIAVLLFAVVMMSVGYATFSANLNVQGTATIDATSKWQVEIIGVEGNASGSAVVGTPTTGVASVSVAPVLVKPGDSATYVVTIKNKGNIPAKLKKVTLSPTTAEEETIDSDDILFTVIQAPAENSILIANAETTFTITVKYNSLKTEEATVKSKSFSALFEYVQAD